MKSAAGVDVGATKTRCTVFDERGNVLGRVEIRGANYLQGGSDSTAAAVREAVSRAHSGQRSKNLEVLAVGAAGCGREGEQQRLKEELQKLGLASIYQVTDDGRSALHAAWPGGAGAVAAAGTGTIVYGKSSSGEYFRVGGLGPVLGDEGGGCRLAIKACSLALKKSDRSGSEALLQFMLEELNLSDKEELFDMIYGGRLPREKLADTAPAIIASASESSGEILLHLLEEELGEFARDISAALIWLPAQKRRLALTGGLTGSDFYRDKLKEAIYNRAEKDNINIKTLKFKKLDHTAGAAIYGIEKAKEAGDIAGEFVNFTPDTGRDEL